MDSGDICWILISSALVMLMIPGLGLFYGGLSRRKNVISMIMHSFVSLSVISVTWILWGYSLSFGPDLNGVIGSLKHLGLMSVGSEPSPFSSRIPHLAFVAYQGMFAAITPALITGAFAERMRFSSYLAFLVAWSTLVYAPVAHWVWGGGWLSMMGVLDFAGGAVVHINSGVAALIAAIMIGSRKGFGKYPMTPHNIPMVALGTAILWFGWFGFNSGSALAANESAVSAFTTTNAAAASASLTWLFIDWKLKGTPSMIGFCTGAVAGLVAITPAAGFVNVQSALIIGALATTICYAAIQFKNRMGFDDALDVWGIHGIGGVWGAIATGIFAVDTGLISGNLNQVMIQLVGVLATVTYSTTVTWIILAIIDKMMGLRVRVQEEDLGLDIALHLEEAYTL
ncbi:MAG: ammonium transporter [Candidatus Bathyarchaeia archaeon]